MRPSWKMADGNPRGCFKFQRIWYTFISGPASPNIKRPGVSHGWFVVSESVTFKPIKNCLGNISGWYTDSFYAKRKIIRSADFKFSACACAYKLFSPLNLESYTIGCAQGLNWFLPIFRHFRSKMADLRHFVLWNMRNTKKYELLCRFYRVELVLK